MSAGDALSSNEALRLSEEARARIAGRAEAAANARRNEPVSIRRDDEPIEQLTVDKFTVGAGERDLDAPDLIDLTNQPEVDELDLRTPGTLETREVSHLDTAAVSTPADSSTTPTPGESTASTGPAAQADLATVALPTHNSPPPPPPEEVAAPAAPTAPKTTSLSMADGFSGDEAAPTPEPPSQTSSLTPVVADTLVVPPPAERDAAAPVVEQPGRRSGLWLLLIASSLAVLSGILATMLLLERSNTSDLEAEVERAQAAERVAVAGLEEVANDTRTLELENDRLQQQLNDMSALVLELPEGRVTEIAVPFVPTFADEENDRLIAVSDTGEYITWGEGADGPITDTGNVSGSPTGLFAATRKAWVTTDAGQVDVLSLVAGEPGLASVDVGDVSFLAAEERGYWTYNRGTQEVVRLKKSDGGVTAAVAVPVPVVDLTIGAGSVWALGDDGRVYRINTADLTVSPLDAGGELISITAGPDALWTLSAADGSLRRIDPVTGEVLVTVPVGRDPIDATFAGRSVWVALRSGSSLIEVDTRTAAVVSRTPLPSEPAALHQGDSGVFVTTTGGETPLLRVASSSPAQPSQADSTEDDAVADESS